MMMLECLSVCRFVMQLDFSLHVFVRVAPAGDPYLLYSDVKVKVKVKVLCRGMMMMIR